MSIKNFELFHGAVLTKMIRNDKPTSIIMVETDPKSLWALYKTNDQTGVYIKYCTKFRSSKKYADKYVWSFLFLKEELEIVNEITKGKSLHYALVCGDAKLSKIMEVCFVNRQQFIELTNKNIVQIRVIKENGKSLKIKSSINKKGFIIPRNALDVWEIPGR